MMRRLSVADSAWPPVLGGLVALAGALLLRTLTGTRLFAEIALEAMVDVLPGQDFSGLLGVFGPYGKALFFGSVLLAELTLYAVAWLRVSRLMGGRVEATVQIAEASALVVSGVLLGVSALLIVVTSASLGARTGWPEYVFATLMTSALFAAVTGLQTLGLAPRAAEDSDEYYEDESRRRFLARIPGLALGGLALIVIARVIRDSAHGGVQRSHRGQPTMPVTPNDEYYIVSKNLIDPQVGEGSWSLHVGGLVRQKLDLRYNDLLAFEAQEQYTTMQCISNEVGGELISNALWRGVPLKTVLDRAGIDSTASFVLFRCVDGYTETLPLDFATRDPVILAYQMNGQPLPQKHGFPVRLLAPGKYGVKHPKWLTDIMVMDEDSAGFWEQQGWSQEARMNTSVRIDVPGPFMDIPPQPYLVEGLAFSGDRGISRVEVSTDDQESWQEATLKPPLGPYTWVLWEYNWQVPAGKLGNARIWARATDGEGELQTAERADPYPSGATGYHGVVVKISDKLPM